MAPRSAPERPPRPTTPPSPERPVAQDSAFPVFPGYGHHVQTDQSNDTPRQMKQSEAPFNHQFTLPPPKTKAGLNFLKRMNSLAPKEGQNQADRPAGLFRRKSSKQLNKKEITLVQGSFRRGSDSTTPVPAQAALIQTAELSSIAKRDGDGRPLPSGPAPPRPPPPDRIDGLMEHLHTNVATVMVHPASPDKLTPSSHGESSEFDFQVPEQYTQRDSVSSIYSVNLSPSPERIHTSYSALKRISEVDDAPGSFEDSAPSTWPSTPNPESAATSPKSAVDQVPPLPGFAEHHNKVLHHAPSESVSSNSSRSGVGDRASSLRSSPPTSNGSSFSLRKQALDDHNLEGQEARNRAANFSRPRFAETPTTPQIITSPPLDAASPQSPILPESPMDPAMHNGALTMPAKEFDVSPVSPQAAGGASDFVRHPLQKSHTDPLPSTERPRVGKRAVTGSKGDCRGCGKGIIGKSIKAADGRLTGRYHKECFVCKTCSLPFQTADFYVFNNFPYCAYHYHVLNHSLCHACNQGIEGQYLESQPRRKYHLHCFTCHDCRQPLTHDYFEINHFFYCELDARRAHQRTTMHGAPRRFPERRTTKLMMM
ncbi:MAG: hypothetical protein M1828_007195 [Chrysothrix sp. TS-e1954]|nr:MAG: hypothetical protein M1828_007195 [Chrysothrix sp. TS-e1954]